MSVISSLWLAADLFCVRDGMSPRHPLKSFLSVFYILFTFCAKSLFISFSECLNFVFHHFQLPFMVLHHLTPSSPLFDFVQLLSPFSCPFPCVSFNLLLFSPATHLLFCILWFERSPRPHIRPPRSRASLVGVRIWR